MSLDYPQLRVGDIIDVEGIRFKLVAFSNPRNRPPKVLFSPVHIPSNRLQVRVNPPEPR